MYKNTQIIAEVKTQSPFGFRATKGWEELFAIADSIGDIISVHTDPRWGGSMDLISKARSMTDKAILAKGVHEEDFDIEEAISAGADYVLVVGRISAVTEVQCWIEPLTLVELKTIPTDFKVVWNSRDLLTGGLKKETFAEARQIRQGWLCQASNIKTIADIEEGADAVIVGTHLEEFAKSLPQI